MDSHLYLPKKLRRSTCICCMICGTSQSDYHIVECKKCGNTDKENFGSWTEYKTKQKKK